MIRTVAAAVVVDLKPSSWFPTARADPSVRIENYEKKTNTLFDIILSSSKNSGLILYDFE